MRIFVNVTRISAILTRKHVIMIMIRIFVKVSGINMIVSWTYVKENWHHYRVFCLFLTRIIIPNKNLFDSGVFLVIIAKTPVNLTNIRVTLGIFLFTIQIFAIISYMFLVLSRIFVLLSLSCIFVLLYEYPRYSCLTKWHMDIRNTFT